MQIVSQITIRGLETPRREWCLVRARFSFGTNYPPTHQPRPSADSLLLPADMPSRDFVDSKGVAWRVWSTVPTGGSVRVTKYVTGWLTFESGDSLRRLIPLPANWEDASIERLELMCRAAQEVERHTGPFARVTPPNAGRRDDERPR